MLKTLSIRNFQAHKESNLTFNEGVNVITGTSDSGKTAVLRSLNWLVTNRPSGDAFKNWDAPLKEPVTVQLELDDGFCVELERQNGKNVYSIYDRDGNQSVFSTIKTDVPTEVTKLLNLSEYNTQSQHQSYFLLQDTPGGIAKKLNDLVGLSVIDTLYTNLASKIRQTSTKIAILTSSRDNTIRDLKEYECLDEIGTIIDTLEKLTAETAGTASSLRQIEEKLSALEQIETERQNYAPLITYETIVNELILQYTTHQENRLRLSKLDKLIETITEVQDQILDEKTWMSLEPEHDDLIKKITELSVASGSLSSISKAIVSGENISRAISTEKASLKGLVDQYITLMKESNICPTCGTKIGDVQLSKIERSFNG
jgi:DNA repair ATPase RecN